MHVVFYRMASRFRRCTEQWTDVDVEPEIGKRRGDYFLTSVVSVLAHLGDQNAGPASFGFSKTLD